MAVQKVIGSSFQSMGTGGVRKDNSAVAISGIILTTSEFNFATMVDAVDETKWTDGVKAKTVFPFFGLDSYEDQSTDATIYESPAQRRKLLRLGKKRFMFNFDLPLDAHKAMQSYRNGDLRMFIVEEDGKIRGYNDAGVFKGFTTSLVNPGKMKEVAPDGNAPALTPLYIDLENYREWDENGDFFYPTWEAANLEPLVPVSITVVSATASKVVVRVGSQDGWEPATGLPRFVGIKGIVVGDFVFLKTNGTANTISTLTDNGDGTYDLNGTGFTTGTVNLKSAATMGSTGLLIDSNGAVAVTIA